LSEVLICTKTQFHYLRREFTHAFRTCKLPSTPSGINSGLAFSMTISPSEKQQMIRAAVSWLGGLTAIVIFWIGLRIVMVFDSYFPPDFQHGFLAGRQSYFRTSVYGAGFYLHIIGAPIALLSGLTQFSRGLLRWSPGLHRLLGRTYAFSVLFAAAPGGLVIGLRTFAGPSAAVCFVVMSLLDDSQLSADGICHPAATHRPRTSRRRGSRYIVISVVGLAKLGPLTGPV
jgi:hypothetical protein